MSFIVDIIMSLALLHPIILGIVIFLVAWFFLVEIVPQHHVAIVERFGQFQYVIKSGIHLVVPPNKVKHSKIGDESAMIDIKYIPILGMSYDIEPVECLSADRVSVKVDGYFLWKITDVQTACYELTPSETLVDQCAIQAIRNIVGRTKSENLNAHDNNLGLQIVEYANTNLASKGVVITQFMVQNIVFDKNIIDANEQITLHKRQLEQERNESVARHSRETLEREHRMKLLDLENKIHMAKTQAIAEEERVRLKTLFDLGFDSSHIVELERNRALAKHSHTFVGGYPSPMYLPPKTNT